MKIMLCSAESRAGDIACNISQIKFFLDKTKNEKPDMLLFGESFLHGFDALCFDYKTDIQTALSINSAPIAEIKKYAALHKTAIGFGFYENDHGAMYSSYIIAGKTGETLCLYKRISQGWRITGTCADYREGKDFIEFEFEGKKLSLFICGDLWEDTLLDKIIDLRADVFLWPVFCGYAAAEWEKDKIDYAARTAILDKPVLFVNSLVKDLHNNETGGGAFVWHLGKLIKELPMGKTGYISYEI